jgi:DNA polymerase-3 subunit alpha
MGKKKAEEMAEHRQIFRDGAAKDGLSQEKADEIFDLMEKFAGYGFNKSHAAAYALLSYHTAYLKAHHPAAFMAANMSLAMDDTDKVKILVEDALDICKLKMLPPDINQSDYRFMPVGEPGKKATQIRYGMGAVKGSGQNAIESIVTARKQGGPFVDLFDFCKRVDKRQVNRRTIESLIRAGAMDCLKQDRAVLLASVDFAMEVAEQAEASANQVSLFGDDDDMIPPPEYVKVDHWSDRQRLLEEKQALGFYLSGHLFDAYAPEVRQFIKTTLAKLDPSRDLRLIGGVIAGLRSQMTQRGRLLIVTLDDGTAVVEVTVYGELAEEYKSVFKEDEFLAVLGKVSEDRFNGGLRITAEKVMDIGRARVQFSQGLRINLDANADTKKLREILQPHLNNEGCPVLVRYKNTTASAELYLSDAWRVNPDDALRKKLGDWLQAANVKIEYA